MSSHSGLCVYIYGCCWHWSFRRHVKHGPGQRGRPLPRTDWVSRNQSNAKQYVTRCVVSGVGRERPENGDQPLNLLIRLWQLHLSSFKDCCVVVWGHSSASLARVHCVSSDRHSRIMIRRVITIDVVMVVVGDVILLVLVRWLAGGWVAGLPK